MSDISVRITLVEDVGKKLSNMAAAARKASSQMDSVGKAVDKAFRSSSMDSFSSKAGTMFASATSGAESFGAAAEEAKSAVEGLESAASEIGSSMASASGAYQDANGRWHDANGRFIASAGKVSDSMKKIQESASGIDPQPLDEIGREAGEAGRKLDGAASSALNLGNVLKTALAAVSVAKIAGEIKDFVAGSVEQGMNFTSMMSEVAAISGADEGELAKLEATAREYGATTVFSATEASEALKYMSLAGWDAGQSTSAIGGVLNLAAASGMGLGEASDMVTDYLSAFGMQADKSDYFADMLSYAQSNSNTTAAQLGQAYLNSAANLHAAGQDIETTTSLLEAMANQGTKGAQAGTQLAAISRDLTNAMEDGAIKIGETSIAVKNSSGDFRDYTEILKEVGTAVDGMGSADRSASLSEVFTADSIRGVNQVLTEGMENITQYEEELRNSAGSAAKAAETMNDNLRGDVANMSSAFEEMQIQVFEGMEGTAREGARYMTDTVIPALTEWVPEAIAGTTESIGKIGKALSPILETVLKNPGAVASAFTAIGTGFAAFKTVNRVGDLTELVSAGGKLSESGGLIGGLAKLGTTLVAHPWAAGAAAVTTAVVAVGKAVEKYNELQVEDNLTEHFGSISLSEEDIEGLAGTVIPVDITADLNLANVAFDEAEELVSQAELLLEQNDAVTWRVLNVEGTLPEDDAGLLLTNTGDFVENVTTALEKEEYGATLSVKATLGDTPGSEQIVEQMRTWFAQDSVAMESLGSSVTDMLENAIEEGTYDINTATAVSILEGKMLDLVNGAKDAELQGKLKFLEATSDDAAMDAQSWADYVDQVNEYQSELADAEAQSYQELFGTLEQFAYNDESRRGTVDAIEDIILAAYNDLETSSLLSGADSMLASLGKAYEEELGTAGERLEETTMGWAENFRDRLSKVTNAGELGNLFDNLLVTGASVSGDLDKTTQNALADRFSHMLPTVEAIQDSIASYYDENGEQLSAIPQNVMDTYYQMMEIGASAGDDGAVAAIVAKQIASAFGDREAFDNALSNAGITMDFMSGLFGGSLVDEINRAFAETTDEVDYSMLLDGIVGAISGEEPDFTKVEELLNTYGYSISNSLKEQGIDLEGEIPVNTEGVTADIDELSKNLEGLNYVGTTTLSGGEIAFQYTINEGETLSGIMEQYGIVWKDVEQQFLEANPEITDPNLIYPNQVINIPEEILLEAAEVDASAVGEAAEEAAKSEASKTIEEEQGVKNTLTDAGVDSTQVGKAAEEAAKSGTGEVIEREQPTQTTMTNAGVDDSQIMQAAEEKETAAEPKEQNVPTTIKFEVVSLDNSEIASAVSEKLLEGEAVPVSVPVDVTSRMGTDNFDETANSFASKFESALRSAFSRTFYATTNASITVDYSIANPSKTITFSGGGSGTATVYAHALGGIFDTPHYGVFAEAGPEAFIPLDGSDNAKMIWKEAGERLGLLGGDEPLSIAPAVLKGGGTGGEKEGQGSHRTVDININGSGKLSVTGGLSKDEVISILIENMRDVLSDIVEQDMFVEGDGSYAY